MNRIIKVAVQLLLAFVFFITSGVTVFATEIRRVPDYDFVEQGFMALTLDVEGAENFRYCGLENKLHTYRGRIKPGDKLTFTVKATLGNTKTLPLTGRSTSVRIQVVAKKGKDVIKSQNFKKDNQISFNLNYTAPEGADTLEVNETFIVNNKSKNTKFNQSLACRNKLILSTKDEGSSASASANAKGGSGLLSENGKVSNITLFAGVAVLLVVMVGGFLFVKKKKQSAGAEEDKEKRRQQVMQYQREKQQQEDQRQQIMQRKREMDERNLALAEEQMRVVEAEQERLMQERVTDTAPRFCSNCGAEMESGDRFCGNCGTKTAPEFCANCGAKLQPDSRFCENCGTMV